MNSTHDILALVESMVEALRRFEGVINDLNVFPVPDGDTGTNMLMTLEAGLAAARGNSSGTSLEMLEALAHGCLMGARGNSGVILSQMVRGFVDSFLQRPEMEGAGLARHFCCASERAYSTVEEPVEGTMLTVMRDIAEAASSEKGDIADLMASVTEAARRSVVATTGMLPVLRDAGVVDAGGYGLEVMATGAARFVGADVTWAEGRKGAEQAGKSAPLAHADLSYRYCTEFAILAPPAKAADALRMKLATLGDCVLVVADSRAAKVHVHCDDPDAAQAIGCEWGSLSEVRVSDMMAEAAERAARLDSTAGIGALAVCSGDGVARLLKGFGNVTVLEEPARGNPSTRMLLEAVSGSPFERVLLLPNNKNIVAAATEAAKMSDKEARVVPTRGVPEAIAALLAMDDEASIEENQTAMTRAAGDVRWGAVSKAARTTAAVVAGDYFFVDRQGTPVPSGDIADACLALARRLARGREEVITLLVGSDAAGSDISRAAYALRSEFPQVEVEVHHGGQPAYQVLLMME